MSGVATAIAAAAVVGAVASDRASDKSADATTDAAAAAAGQLDRSVGQARQDLFDLFPAAQNNAMQGYQGALDVFKQSTPQQMAFGQSGNIAAQNQLINAMPQYQNAILGAPVDYSQFQATDLGQPNLGFMNQQLSYTDPFAQPVGPATPSWVDPLPPVGTIYGGAPTPTQTTAPAQITGPVQAPNLTGVWPGPNYANLNLRSAF